MDGTNVQMGTDAEAAKDGDGSDLNKTNKNTAIGNKAQASGGKATALGYDAQATANNATAIGSGASASATNATAIGAGASASGKNSVAIGSGSVANQDDTVSVGNETTQRRITNMADGKDATDAVTKRQLDAAIKDLGEVNQNLTEKMDRMNRKLRSGIATVSAIANIPVVASAGHSMIGAGVGNYMGETAVGVGYSMMNDAGNVVFKVSGAASKQGTYNVGAGIGYQW